MSNLVQKARLAMKRPERFTRYLRTALPMALRMVKQGRPHHLGAMIVSGITGWNPYVAYLKSRSADGTTVLDSIHGHSMVVDLDDSGLSRNLIMFRTWEERAARAYRRELSALAEQVDDPVVLEIGANIGYYCLQEAHTLGSDATIHAFEPARSNFELLKRNITRNGYTDRVIPRNAAVASDRGTVHFEISSEGNQHRVVETKNKNTVEIPSVSLRDYLKKQEITPDSVSVIRMDVQGLEAEILRNLEDVITADGPLVLFIGLHSKVTDADLRWILDRFEAHFEIASITTGDGVQQWQTVDVEIDSVGELNIDKYDSVELILRNAA